LPKGAKLIGSGSSGEDRLTISFSKVVFKDGVTQNISAEAADPEDQVVGLKGSKVSKYAAMVAAAGALSFAGGVAEGMQETENQGGVITKKANLKNAALNGAARATIDVGSEIVTSWKNKKSVIVVKEGSSLIVVFDSN
jgi:type IV secretory pathway VirB10-like protein